MPTTKSFATAPLACLAGAVALLASWPCAAQTPRQFAAARGLAGRKRAGHRRHQRTRDPGGHARGSAA